mmetsp:Transcript_104961/g.338476  ORF Transcript_104961/g.338476 Transcript_104961/m.338476 type:complete len:210 (+) Transcript_104961:492-1121(+)
MKTNDPGSARAARTGSSASPVVADQRKDGPPGTLHGWWHSQRASPRRTWANQLPAGKRSKIRAARRRTVGASGTSTASCAAGPRRPMASSRFPSCCLLQIDFRVMTCTSYGGAPVGRTEQSAVTALLTSLRTGARNDCLETTRTRHWPAPPAPAVMPSTSTYLDQSAWTGSPLLCTLPSNCALSRTSVRFHWRASLTSVFKFRNLCRKP